MTAGWRSAFLALVGLVLVLIAGLIQWTGLQIPLHTSVPSKFQSRFRHHGSQQFESTSAGVPMVLLVCYFRSGSSFLGQILASNPGTFYVFEPLRPILASVYGVSINPTEHFYENDNDTLPERPQFEKTLVAKSISALLNCDMWKLPLEFFLDGFRFWNEEKYLSPYRSCVKTMKGETRNCSGLLRTSCKGASLDCASRVEQALHCQGHNSSCEVFKADPQNRPFIEKRECLNSHQTPQMAHCQSLMQDLCERASVRSTKAIRMQMDQVEGVLDHSPHVKVIHLVRDPRAILMSIANIGTRLDISRWAKKAQHFCNRMLLDLTVSSRVRISHPDSVLAVRYEDLASHSHDVAEKIYTHIGLTVPPEVTIWIEENTHGDRDSGRMGTKRANSSAHAYHWMDDISQERHASFLNIPQCRDVLKQLNYSLTLASKR